MYFIEMDILHQIRFIQARCYLLLIKDALYIVFRYIPQKIKIIYI